jgi:2,4-dichlorophenol 6-monooxygenase
MADIQTDVLIIGTGPAGSATAALINGGAAVDLRHREHGDQPLPLAGQHAARAYHQPAHHGGAARSGQEVEDEAYMFAAHQDLMGENVFCESLAGEEIGRMKSWGNHPLSKAEHLLSSPNHDERPAADLHGAAAVQDRLLARHAGADVDGVSRHEQDADGVTTTCLDRLTGKESPSARNTWSALMAAIPRWPSWRLPFEGQMGVGGSMNIIFKADLSKYVAHRPSVLYWVVQPGADVGGIGMGLVRMVRPWNEWLIVWGYDINGPEPVVDNAFATKVVRDLVGDQSLEPEITSARPGRSTTCTPRTCSRAVSSSWATQRTGIRPPTGLAPTPRSRTASTLPGSWPRFSRDQAGESLLDTYSQERAPVAKQIVTRANQSIGEFGPIFEALGLTESTDPEVMQANMDKRCDVTAEAEKQRAAIREAIAFKKYEFDAHGVEMNQRYKSSAW